MKKIIKETFHIIIFVFAICIAFFIFSSRMSIFGLHSYTVVTGSMEPTIHTNSAIFTVPASYKIGDIITFKRGDITVTHRIIGTKNNQFETKGDANKAADSIFVNKNEVFGKVIFEIPYIGKLTTFSKTISGFNLLIVIPTILFIFFEAKTLKMEWEKEIEKKLMHKMHSAENL